jgi:hypothetical protein
MTNNLDLAHIAPSQNNKETTINDQRAVTDVSKSLQLRNHLEAARCHVGGVPNDRTDVEGRSTETTRSTEHVSLDL